tara:strand:+ start:7741 stop:8331 length:591 start_codon:yes stop_codon:yes gene_type:complete
MLDLITLNTIDKVFIERDCKTLSVSSQYLYIRCLMYHFKNKKPNVKNQESFDLLFNDIPKYRTWENNFKALQTKGLVTVTDNSIHFVNVWGQYIDRKMLKENAPENSKKEKDLYVEYEKEILMNSTLLEMCCMKQKLSLNKIKRLLKDFITEQKAFNNTYGDSSECGKHFHYWLNNNSKNVTNEKVTSTSQILGKQ